jgi:hypothetical protein
VPVFFPESERRSFMLIQNCRLNIRNISKKFWEELISYFPSTTIRCDTGRIEIIVPNSYSCLPSCCLPTAVSSGSTIAAFRR